MTRSNHSSTTARPSANSSPSSRGAVQVMRSWLPFAAVGAAVIHLAIALHSPVLITVLLVCLGVLEVGWAVAVLVVGRVVVPKGAFVGAVLPFGLWSVVVLAGAMLRDAMVAGLLPVLPMLVVAVFELGAAVVITHGLRSPSGQQHHTRDSRHAVGGVFAGAILIAVFTTSGVGLAQAAAGVADRPVLIPAQNHLH